MNPKRCKHGVFDRCPDCAAERERRERIACHLLAGLLSNPVHTDLAVSMNDLTASAGIALEAADRLISKLDEGKDRPS